MGHRNRRSMPPASKPPTPSTGNAAWFGSVNENGHPAIYAVRVHVTERRDRRDRERGPPQDGAPGAVRRRHARWSTTPSSTRSCRPNGAAAASACCRSPTPISTPSRSTTARSSRRSPTTAPGSRTASSTTAPTPGSTGGNAASIASGCREQFELGIYRINKRVRRDFFIVDEERGVAVGRGFFDHANEWDRYLLTNGREMKTALKWPNSITLLEAFRMRDGRDQSRIEAVFTYVPYFMHNPFWGPSPTPPPAAPTPAACDTACIAANTNAVHGRLPGARPVGVAAVGRRASATPRTASASASTKASGRASPRSTPSRWSSPTRSTGKGVWIGRIEEHGQPAWAAITVRSAGRRIDSIDALIRRKEYGPPYAEPNGATQFAALPAVAPHQPRRHDRRRRTRSPRPSTARPARAPDGARRRRASGRSTARTSAPAPPLSAARRSPASSAVRDRSVLAVDEERGPDRGAPVRGPARGRPGLPAHLPGGRNSCASRAARSPASRRSPRSCPTA